MQLASCDREQVADGVGHLDFWARPTFNATYSDDDDDDDEEEYYDHDDDFDDEEYGDDDHVDRDQHST